MQCVLGTAGVQLLEHARGAHHEDARVPEVLAAREVLLGRRGVGLLDELRRPVRQRASPLELRQRLGCADVAVARLGTSGVDADGDDVAVLGSGDRCVDRVCPHVPVFEQVVAGKHHHDRVGVLGGERRRGKRDRGRRVLGQRLLDVADRMQCGIGLGREVVAKLVEEPLVGGDHHRGAPLGKREDPMHRLRDERLGPKHREQLLGIELARQGPEALAATAGEDDGVDLGHAYSPPSGAAPAFSQRRILSRLSRNASPYSASPRPIMTFASSQEITLPVSNPSSGSTTTA